MRADILGYIFRKLSLEQLNVMNIIIRRPDTEEINLFFGWEDSIDDESKARILNMRTYICAWNGRDKKFTFPNLKQDENYHRSVAMVHI